MSSIGRYSGRATGGNPGFSSSVANGKIPTNLLGHLDSQPVTPQFPESEHWLAKEAALGFDAMVRAAEKDGVKIRLLEAYRALARQEYFWDQYLHHGGNLAARPGTSNHGWGTAIDVDRKNYPAALPWMRENATQFGWDLPDQLGKSEPWHWQWIRGFKWEGSPILLPRPTPVYVHGELVPGGYHTTHANRAIIFLRPVAEALGYEVEVRGEVVTLVPDEGRAVNLPLDKTPEGRAIFSARELCERLGIPCTWDGKAVRIG